MTQKSIKKANHKAILVAKFGENYREQFNPELVSFSKETNEQWEKQMSMLYAIHQEIAPKLQAIRLAEDLVFRTIRSE